MTEFHTQVAFSGQKVVRQNKAFSAEGISDSLVQNETIYSILPRVYWFSMYGMWKYILNIDQKPRMPSFTMPVLQMSYLVIQLLWAEVSTITKAAKFKINLFCSVVNCFMKKWWISLLSLAASFGERFIAEWIYTPFFTETGKMASERQGGFLKKLLVKTTKC